MSVADYLTKLELVRAEHARVVETEAAGNWAKVRPLKELEAEVESLKKAAEAEAKRAEAATKADREISTERRRLQETLGNINDLEASGAIIAEDAGRRRARAHADYEKAVSQASNVADESNRIISEQLRLAAAGVLSFDDFGKSLLNTKTELKGLTEAGFQEKLKEIVNAAQFAGVSHQDAIDQVLALATAYQRDLTEAANKAAQAQKQHAEEIARQNKRAEESWEDLGRTTVRSQRDALQKVAEIQRRHDEEYNQAIDTAQAQQDELKARQIRDEETAGETRVEARKKILDDLDELDRGADDATIERNIRVDRQGADRERNRLEREKETERQRADVRDDSEKRLREITDRYGVDGSGGKEAAEDQRARDRTVAEARDTLAEGQAAADDRRDERRADAERRRNEQVADARDRRAEAETGAAVARTKALADADERRSDDLAKARERRADSAADADARRLESLAAEQARHDERRAAAHERAASALADAEARRAEAANEAVTRTADRVQAQAQRVIDQLAKPDEKADETERAKRVAEAQLTYERQLSEAEAQRRAAVAAAQNTQDITNARERHTQAVRDIEAERAAATDAAQTGGTTNPRAEVARRAAEENADHERRLTDELDRHERARDASRTDAEKADERERYREAVRLLEQQHATRLRQIALESGLLTEGEQAEANAAFALIDREHRVRLSDLQDEEDARAAEAARALETQLAAAETVHADALAKAERAHKDALEKAQAVYDDAAAKAQKTYTNSQERANERHADVLAKAQAQYDDVAEKAERTHTNALDTANREHEDAQAKAQDQFDDAEEKQLKGHEAALLKINERYTEEKGKIEAAAADRLKTIGDTEQRQKDATTSAYDLQDEREAEDHKRRQDNTRERKDEELQTIEDRYTKEVERINDRIALEIEQSNNALTKKQEAADGQRQTDYTKFYQDLSDRMADIETKWSETMGDLDKLIPGDVRRLLQGGANLVGSVVAQVGGAVSANSGTVPAASRPGERDWATFNALVNSGTSRDEADRRSRGAGAGPAGTGDDLPTGPPSGTLAGFGDVLAELKRNTASSRTAAETESQRQIKAGVLGGDGFTASGMPSRTSTPGTPTTSGAEGLNWAISRVGQPIYQGQCQKFVENAYGTGGVYPDAWTAAQNMVTSPGGTVAGAPSGSLVYFRRDASNGNFGHVGISMGGGKFVSALYTGVAVQEGNNYWNNLYAGWGNPSFPRRAFGGDVAAGQPIVVGETGSAEVFVPRQAGTVYPSTNPFVIDYDRLGAAVAQAVSQVVGRMTTAAAPAPRAPITINANGADPGAVVREVARYQRRQDLLDRSALVGAV